MKIGVALGVITTIFWLGTAYIAWVRYPNCGPDHVPAFAFYNTNTLWVCARGFEPPWPH